jgi:hypothetical protein
VIFFISLCVVRAKIDFLHVCHACKSGAWIGSSFRPTKLALFTNLTSFPPHPTTTTTTIGSGVTTSPNERARDTKTGVQLTERERILVLMAIACAHRQYKPESKRPRMSRPFFDLVRSILDEPFFEGKIRKFSAGSPSDSTIKNLLCTYEETGRAAPKPKGGRRRDENKWHQVEMVLKSGQMPIREAAQRASVSVGFVHSCLKALKKSKRAEQKQGARLGTDQTS